MSPHDLPVLKVLVADDHPLNRRLVQAVLRQQGHRLVLVADGREAVAAVEQETFDLVLMDLQMEEMDGFEATARIRAREETTGERATIVAMTAATDPGDRERCRAAGMDGFLAKPIRHEELTALVEELSEGRGKRATPPETPARRLDERLRGKLVGPFLADAKRLSREIEDALKRRDGAAVARAAHQLLGSAGWFQSTGLVELARQLEKLGKTGDWTAAAGVHQELAEALARLEQDLRR